MHFEESRILCGWGMVPFLALIALLNISNDFAVAADVPGKTVDDFRAGAAAVDVTPPTFPVIVNGYFTERLAQRANDRVMSRAIVLDDGKMQLAIVVVDNLMIPRSLLDDAKEIAHSSTGIPTNRMLISATHDHMAPSAMGCLGSRADEAYQKFLVPEIAKSIEQAFTNLAPAQVGWTVVQDTQHNHTRRWIFRPDRISVDPFGERNVRAMMHPGYQSPNHIAPSGPADHDLSLLSVQSREGKPIAVLANYAMHYYGSNPVSSDFCGHFGNQLASLIGAESTDPPFVGIMSQGTSGDTMWMDYSKPAPKRDIDQYTLEVAQVALAAYESIQYHDSVPLGMAETTLTLRRRVPDEKRLAWAREVVAGIGDRLPKTKPEIYAREQIYLHDQPEVEIKLQAIRIGDLGITAIPNEVYGLTGMKLKAQSPLQPTFNIELANGAQGYIPPPEQHALGGYTTWAARTAGLEVQAEPKIVSALLGLLEKVSGKPRHKAVPPANKYSAAVEKSQPQAYWRFGEQSGPRAIDSLGKHHGNYEDGVAFFLPGYQEHSTLRSESKSDRPNIMANRAAHFAGGRMHAQLDDLGATYSVELWFWNGLPHDARAVTGYIFSRGAPGSKEAAGDHLGIGGTYHEGTEAGKLIFFNGNEKNELLVGQTELPLKTWNHVVLVRDGRKVTVYLNGSETPEIQGEVSVSRTGSSGDIFLGGRNDRFAPFEGKLSDVAIYNRVLSKKEVAQHFASADVSPPGNQNHKKRNKSPQTSASEQSRKTTPLQPDDPPLSPTESLAATHVRDGYEIQLVAAEPLVKDPVAIAWGPDGRLWVAEMADYPMGMDGKGKPGGRIRILEDTNHDGKYDRSSIFLEGVRFPNGLMPWRNGVLITAAPEIIFAEDTDADGKADRSEVLFSGFQEGNQQLRVNGLRWGLDNWIYCASGAHHGGYGADRSLMAEKTGKKINLGSRDFRFRADSGELDPQSGPSQFGRNRDDWGNWFGQQNSHPLWHFVLKDDYLRRNPHFAPPDPRKELVGPSNPPVYPAKSPQKRFHSFEQSGRFTSACSAMIYRDELLFPRTEHTEHAFTCEPFHNLVQHNVIVDEGVSFVSHRDPAEGEIDFFASKDRWCRPVMVRTGPDGALWVVDMYRYMIEHPQWLTPEGRKELEPFYRAGEDRGRIYRIVRKGQPPRQIPNLEALSKTELVQALESPNGTQRDLVSQLLRQRENQATVPLLEKLAKESPHPLARLHALCALDGLGRPAASLLQDALHDEHAGVRRNAIRVAEPFGNKYPQLRAAAIELVDDPDAKVRLQLACTLGQWTGVESARALAKLAVRDAEDPYQVAAITSSINQKNLGDVLSVILADRENPAAGRWVGQLLALSVAFGNRPATIDGLESIMSLDQETDFRWQCEIVAGLLDSLKLRGMTLVELLDETGDRGRKLQQQMTALTDRARQTSFDPRADAGVRSTAIGLLARNDADQTADIDRMKTLLTPQTSSDVQAAVIRRLGSLSEPAISQVLLSGWRSHAPGLRSEIIGVLLSRRPWLSDLLDAIESGHVSWADIDASSRQSLSAYGDKAIRQRVAKLHASSGNANRKQVLLEHQDVLKLTGSPQRGKAVFKKNCSVCHKLDGVGHDIGPNLRSLTDKKPASLLTSILDPSAAVDGKFVTYLAVTDDGRMFSGMIASDTGNSITLVEQEKKQKVILRSHLEELRSTGKSLMPEGLEKNISHQDFADLISYLRSKETK